MRTVDGQVVVQRVELLVVFDRVRAVRAAEQLQRRQVHHVVARLRRRLQARHPLVDRPELLADVRLARDRVERQHARRRARRLPHAQRRVHHHIEVAVRVLWPFTV